MRSNSCNPALALVAACVLGFLLTGSRVGSGSEPRAVGTVKPNASPAEPDSTFQANAARLPFRFQEAQDLAASSASHLRRFEPAGVVVDDFGRVYVSDGGLHRLLRLDRSGVWLGESGSLGSGEGRMRRPGAVAILGTLSVAVLDRENRRVQSYDLFGRLLGTLIDLQSDALDRELGRVDPVGLAADRGAAVTVADADRDRLLVFDFSGRFLRVVGGYGERPGSFRGLRAVASGRSGELATVERDNARVQRLDPSGRPLVSWPLDVSAGTGALAIATDDSTRIAVADPLAGRLWLFDTSGQLQAIDEGLEAPSAVAFAPGGTLIVGGGAGWLKRYEVKPRDDPAAAPRE